VSSEVPQGSSGHIQSSVRNVLCALGFILWIVFLVPPLISWTKSYEFVQAAQYCCFAIVVPFLLVAGGSWRCLGLAPSSELRIDSDGVPVAVSKPRRIDRFAIRSSRRIGHRQVVTMVIIFVGQSIFWRSSPVVDALIRHPWLSTIESLTLILAGVFLWLDLVEASPFHPGATRPYRIGVSAISMWTVWVLAYLTAMSQDPWYRGFQHVAGQGLSPSADQQFTAGVMWFISAAAFLPVIFSNLIRWLKSEDDPDDELYRLVRRDHTRGFFGTNP